MKKIINPISTSVLEQEINKDTFVRKTNYCNHDIYIVDYHHQPNTTLEIGRLREISFRNAGGGTGKSYDNLWDGLGALVVDHPEIKYFFGKVTMYLDFDKKGRDLILGFMNHFFKDKDQWISAKQPLELHHDISYFIEQIKELDYKESYKILTKKLKELNCSLPPLIAAYMNLSSSMKTFGTAMNSKFGDVEETGILISIDDIYPEKKDRHVNTYKKLK